MYDAAGEHTGGDVTLPGPQDRGQVADREQYAGDSVRGVHPGEAEIVLDIWWVGVVLDILGAITLFAIVALATSAADASGVTVVVAALVLVSRCTRLRHPGSVPAGSSVWSTRDVGDGA